MRLIHAIAFNFTENHNFYLIFVLSDEKQFRSLILWLEDQKIRHYKIEDREGLRLIDSPKWEDSYQKYLRDVACPFMKAKRADQLEWLIGHGINLEYSDNGKTIVHT